MLSFTKCAMTDSIHSNRVVVNIYAQCLNRTFYCLKCILSIITSATRERKRGQRPQIAGCSFTKIEWNEEPNESISQPFRPRVESKGLNFSPNLFPGFSTIRPSPSLSTADHRPDNTCRMDLFSRWASQFPAARPAPAAAAAAAASSASGAVFSASTADLGPLRRPHPRTRRAPASASARTMPPPMALVLSLMISIATLSPWPSTVHAQQVTQMGSSSTTTTTTLQTTTTAVGASGKQQQDFQRIWLNGQSIKMPVPLVSTATVSEGLSPRFGCNLA